MPTVDPAIIRRSRDRFVELLNAYGEERLVFHEGVTCVVETWDWQIDEHGFTVKARCLRPISQSLWPWGEREWAFGHSFESMDFGPNGRVTGYGPPVIWMDRDILRIAEATPLDTGALKEALWRV
jgi:hypothetical protein